jgi:hypothetical protein
VLASDAQEVAFDDSRDSQTSMRKNEQRSELSNPSKRIGEASDIPCLSSLSSTRSGRTRPNKLKVGFTLPELPDADRLPKLLARRSDMENAGEGGTSTLDCMEQTNNSLIGKQPSPSRMRVSIRPHDDADRRGAHCARLKSHEDLDREFELLFASDWDPGIKADRGIYANEAGRRRSTISKRRKALAYFDSLFPDNDGLELAKDKQECAN